MSSGAGGEVLREVLILACTQALTPAPLSEFLATHPDPTVRYAHARRPRLCPPSPAEVAWERDPSTQATLALRGESPPPPSTWVSAQTGWACALREEAGEENTLAALAGTVPGGNIRWLIEQLESGLITAAGRAQVERALVDVLVGTSTHSGAVGLAGGLGGGLSALAPALSTSTGARRMIYALRDLMRERSLQGALDACTVLGVCTPDPGEGVAEAGGGLGEAETILEGGILAARGLAGHLPSLRACQRILAAARLGEGEAAGEQAGAAAGGYDPEGGWRASAHRRGMCTVLGVAARERALTELGGVEEFFQGEDPALVHIREILTHRVAGADEVGAGQRREQHMLELGLGLHAENDLDSGEELLHQARQTSPALLGLTHLQVSPRGCGRLAAEMYDQVGPAGLEVLAGLLPTHEGSLDEALQVCQLVLV